MTKTFTTTKLLLVFLISSLTIPVMAQDFDWAIGIGGSGNDQGLSIAVDGQGHVYLAGKYTDTVDFDPGAGTTFLEGTGLFLAKYTQNGEYLWAKGFPITHNNADINLAVDAHSNVYLAGNFEGTVDFDGGPGVDTITSGDYMDIFFAKYDADGNYLWVKTIGGPDVEDVNAITLDPSGHILLTGEFRGTIDFDPDTATANLSAPGHFDSDVFLAKYDADGHYVWAKNMGGDNSGDRGHAIAVSNTGNIYIAGSFQDTADFDPGVNVANLYPAGPFSLFIAKYDSQGNYSWAKSINGPSSTGSTAFSIALNSTEDVYVTGNFNGSMDFDPGSPSVNISSSGGYDAFLACYDSAGSYVWASKFGGSGFVDRGTSLAIDASDHIYLTGYFQSTVDFDPGANSSTLTAVGGVNAFLLRLDNNRNFVSVKQFHRTYSEALALDVLGNAHMTGRFLATVDFDPGVDTFDLTAEGAGDIFVLKLSHSCATFASFTETACDSFSFSGTTYTSSGVYIDTLVNSNNCDSIVFLNLTVNYSSVNPDVTGHYCDSVSFNGTTYTSSGVYVQPYLNATGCDSSITYDITVGESHEIQQVVSSCGSYTINDSVLNNSGVYTFIFLNSTGCDSIIHLDLTVTLMNTEVLQNGGTLTANTADAYQWINCTDGMEIPGATAQTFVATENGDYAVILTLDDCVDTSACYTIDHLTSIEGVGGNEPGIWIYPNPVTGGKLTIQSDQMLLDARIRLTDMAGRVLMQSLNNRGSVFTIDLESYAADLYLLEIFDSSLNKGKTFKITKPD